MVLSLISRAQIAQGMSSSKDEGALMIVLVAPKIVSSARGRSLLYSLKGKPDDTWREFPKNDS